MSIGIAIIGSGIFAREEHLPILLNQNNQHKHPFTLKALYSRTLKSAEALLASVKTPKEAAADAVRKIDVYAEDAGEGRTYEDLLGREDVMAFVIALPIPTQPPYILRALTAGKHVLSEKPIAGDLRTAREMVSFYEALSPSPSPSQPSETNGTIQSTDENDNNDNNNNNNKKKKPLWAVAENHRFLTKYHLAATEVRKLGRVKGLRVLVRSYIGEGSKYHQTPWRRHPTHIGGFLLDGGVHIIAALRLILSATSDAITTVSGMTSLHRPHLHPMDTLDAIVRTRSGATGTISLCYGSQGGSTSLFEIVCERGVVTLDGDWVRVDGEEGVEV
ncbi:NAD(P)-binding protein, partial [Aspergillus ellipticus CBS 707.79]